ncbi:MAG: prepilin-type N-terminal cleavage/methylation domain-containing protein [Pseudomonadota bacterium]|jgi:MSHA biogenesis protein MshO
MTERRGRGFSLIEAAIAIAILGVVAAVVAVFLRGPAEGYFDTARRAALTEAADNAIRRLARDVRAALPSSVRPGPTNQCFEFLPNHGGGRYRIEPQAGGGGDVLDLTTADGAFDVLAASALPNFGASASGTYQAVVYNLGIPGADAYAGDNRTGLASTSTASLFNLTPAKQFPFGSPARRVLVTENFAVVYSCSGGALLRSTRPISAAPLASCPASGTALAASVFSCAFDYTAAVNTRFGVLAVMLELSSGGEKVQLYHEIHVDNVP